MERVRLFRIAAIAEACSWAGLLIGMFFKYVVVEEEIGVQIFGPIHGVLFLAYIVIAVLTWQRLGWPSNVGIVALAVSIPPFGTAIFERWATRTGRLPAHDPAPAPA